MRGEGGLVPPTGETGFETFEVRRTTLFALLRGSRALRLCLAFSAGSSLGLAIGFVLGIGAVAWW